MSERLTEHGFEWGPIKVTRAAGIEGRRILFLKTIGNGDRVWHRVQICVSPAGRSVRVWLDGKEMK